MLSGCSLFIPDVHDLHLVDVQPSKYVMDSPRTPGRGVGDQSPDHWIGRIDVATQSDVVNIVHASELTLWARLTICQSGAAVPNYGVTGKGLELFYVGVENDLYARYLERAGQDRSGEPFTYQIYFDLRSTRSQPKAPEQGQPDLFEPFDLPKEPLDLCLQIGGGNMLGQSFKSNTVVVPAVP